MRRLVMHPLLSICMAAFVASASSLAQESNPGAKPTERIIGTVTAVDQGNHSVTVKEDKTGTVYNVQLATTRTLLKVQPGAKDLKNATRITADDLAMGDRVQVGGSKTPENPNTVVARSIILMSARELQELHQEQRAAWQHSTPGVVTAVDAAGHKLNVTARTPAGPKPLVIDATNAEFTRYSPETLGTPASSEINDIQPGDQVRIIGEMSPESANMTAQKIYSSSFRTIVGTVSSVTEGGKEIKIKNLQNKQTVMLTLNDESAVRRLPPMLAYGLARRFNPEFKAPQSGEQAAAGAGQGSTAGAPPYGAKAGEGQTPGAGPGGRGNWNGGNSAGPGGPGAQRGVANGDLSQMLDRLPKISATDLKPGDAVVISGSPQGSDPSHLLATNVIAGVEPIFQSSSSRQAQSLGDWGASLSGGGMEAGTGMPGGGPQ